MKKSEIAEAYRKYLWPKCSKTTFYANLKKWMWINEAIKPIIKEERYKNVGIKTTRFKREMERYKQQIYPKVPRSRFYQRLYQGWSKEEAIKLWVLPVHHTKPKKKKKPVYQRPVKIPLQKEVKIEKDIKIKYSKEEAKAIAKEYEKIIEDLKIQYYAIDDVIESRAIADKINKLEKEYKTFILYNN